MNHGSDITIVLAGDDRVVRSGLRLLLQGEPGIAVVGEVGDADSALVMVAARRPDVLVLDLDGSGGSSLFAIPDVPECTRVVVLTAQDDPVFAQEALQRGAAGYAIKETAVEGLVAAVRAAAAGHTYLDPGIGARLAMAPVAAAGPPDALTGREVGVLGLIALGHTNNEIAQQLFLSVRTVESHRAHIQRKTGQTTRAQLVRYAFDHRLVDTG